MTKIESPDAWSAELARVAVSLKIDRRDEGQSNTRAEMLNESITTHARLASDIAMARALAGFGQVKGDELPEVFVAAL